MVSHGWPYFRLGRTGESRSILKESVFFSSIGRQVSAHCAEPMTRTDSVPRSTTDNLFCLLPLSILREVVGACFLLVVWQVFHEEYECQCCGFLGHGL